MADKDVPHGYEGHTQWFDPMDIEISNNPRLHNNPGFSPEKMRELREDIRRYGLKQNLEVRIMEDGKVRLIAGERRLRSIRLLREENVDCYDRRSRKMLPAEEVYAVVPCAITDCASDKDAMRAAVMENLLHEHLTDYEVLLQCEILEEAGHSRAEQAEIFNKSEAWVSQSHSLLGGHPKVLQALAQGTLGRTQALQFLQVPPEKVETVLERAIYYSSMEYDEKEKELIVERNKTYNDLEMHESQLRAAQEFGDKTGMDQARQAMQEDERHADAAERRLKKHRVGGRRKPKPTINNIQQAKDEQAIDNGSHRHMPVKTWRRIADKLEDFLRSGETLVNPDTGREYNRREVRIVLEVMNCFLNRNGLKDPLCALIHVDDAGV